MKTMCQGKVEKKDWRPKRPDMAFSGLSWKASLPRVRDKQYTTKQSPVSDDTGSVLNKHNWHTAFSEENNHKQNHKTP